MILRIHSLEDVRVIEKYKIPSLHIPWLDGGTRKNKNLEDRVERTRKSVMDIWRIVTRTRKGRYVTGS